MDKKGLFKKYSVEHLEGQTDPTADYFVLRLDSDRTARLAALAYAKLCEKENPQLSADLIRKVAQYDEAVVSGYIIAGLQSENTLTQAAIDHEFSQVGLAPPRLEK